MIDQHDFYAKDNFRIIQLIEYVQLKILKSGPTPDDVTYGCVVMYIEGYVTVVL